MSSNPRHEWDRAELVVLGHVLWCPSATSKTREHCPIASVMLNHP